MGVDVEGERESVVRSVEEDENVCWNHPERRPEISASRAGEPPPALFPFDLRRLYDSSVERLIGRAVDIVRERLTSAPSPCLLWPSL